MKTLTKAIPNWSPIKILKALSKIPNPERLATPSELKAAQRLIKGAKTKAAEDERNKSKKLQRILSDHEDIVDLIRLLMSKSGFQSEQRDFYEKQCDVKFTIRESQLNIFWAIFQEILDNHT